MKSFPKPSTVAKTHGENPSAKIDEDLLDFLPKEEKQKGDFTVTLRVPKSVHDKLTKMVIQRSADTGEILNKSTYLRLLIEKDFKERTKIPF